MHLRALLKRTARSILVYWTQHPHGDEEIHDETLAVFEMDIAHGDMKRTDTITTTLLVNLANSQT